MRIHVGSKNQIKIQAVTDAVLLYPTLFPDPEVVGIEVNVPEFGHPKNLEESVTGAMERAKNAFMDCEYSFGIEGGLLEVPFTQTGFMETNVCAVYDGNQCYIGLGPSFEWPKDVTDLIISGKADASKAFYELGLTKHEKLGAQKGGIVGVLTDGKITRESFIKYSIIMALVKLEKKEYYQ